LDECIDFVGEATDRVGKVVDELNSRIDVQDVQINQLANMVEEQAKAIKSLKESQEDQRKVINWMTTKVITLEQYTEDIQKVFPQVGGGEQLGFLRVTTDAVFLL
jgi:methyl-accepting chemotaxis protein